MGHPAFDPFAGGKMNMSEVLFKAALSVLAKPPNDPANLAIDTNVWAAAMVVGFRQDALNSIAGRGRNGSKAPTEFICPICRDPVLHNPMNQAYECRNCARGVTFDWLKRVFSPQGVVGIPGQNTRIPKSRAAKAASSHNWPAPSMPGSLTKGGLAPTKGQVIEKDESDEPIKQWRSWKVDLSGGLELRLKAVSHNELWTPKQPLEAMHHGSGCTIPAGVTRPDWSCSCGIYGVRTIAQAQKWGSTSPPYIHLVGKASYWGRVLQFQNGLRAQYAYPYTIYVPEEPTLYSHEYHPERLRNELRDIYGVEVVIDDGMFPLGLSHV